MNHSRVGAADGMRRAGFERAGVNHTCSAEVIRLFRRKSPRARLSTEPRETQHNALRQHLIIWIMDELEHHREDARVLVDPRASAASVARSLHDVRRANSDCEPMASSTHRLSRDLGTPRLRCSPDERTRASLTHGSKQRRRWSDEAHGARCSRAKKL